MSVQLPPAFRAFYDGSAEVEVEATNVAEALASLADRANELRSRLFSGSGALRSSVVVYVDEQDFRYLDRERTVLHDGSRLSIVSALAGG
ncbi:MAG: MoaD/ThiS family protein [Thermoplasmata archaeon]|nr:MoaD/ThiS family protein [Thermoplasmata archaeon]